MNEIKLFDNKELELSVRAIMNEDGSISASVDDVLKLFNITINQVNRILSKYNDNKYKINYNDEWIHESVFYLLLMNMNDKQSLDIQKHLVEILAQIKKTGGYVPISNKDSNDDILQNAFKIAEKTLKTNSFKNNYNINDLFNNISNVRFDENGSILYDTKEVAIGLGFIKIDRKNGKEYIRADYPRINKFINEFGCSYKIKKGDFIPLDIVWKLYDKSKSPNKHKFAQFLCESLNIEKPIIQCEKRRELKFIDELEIVLKELNINDGVKQYAIQSDDKTYYRIDYYIPSLKLAIEYDENEHKSYTYEQQEGRQIYIENKLHCEFIRINDNNSNLKNIGIIINSILRQFKNNQQEESA